MRLLKDCGKYSSFIFSFFFHLFRRMSKLNQKAVINKACFKIPLNQMKTPSWKWKLVA
jgi:hypothetical protein